MVYTLSGVSDDFICIKKPDQSDDPRTIISIFFEEHHLFVTHLHVCQIQTAELPSFFGLCNNCGRFVWPLWVLYLIGRLVLLLELHSCIYFHVIYYACLVRQRFKPAFLSTRSFNNFFFPLQATSLQVNARFSKNHFNDDF